jgi:hypothetical protein
VGCEAEELEANGFRSREVTDFQDYWLSGTGASSARSIFLALRMFMWAERGPGLMAEA